MIKRDEFTPLYIQFHSLLKEELLRYPIGSNIPPERALCQSYDLDRVTVRKALAMLAEEGYISRKRGRGTTVLRHEQKTIDNVLFIICQGTHMVDRLGEPFYAKSLDMLEEQLHRLDKRLVYSKILPTDNLEDLYKRLGAQAIIFAGTPDEAILKQCRKLALPLLGYNTDLRDYPTVMVDNDYAAAVSAQHLLKLGHRNIGFIHVPGHINSENRLRRFRLELKNFKCDETSLTIAESEHWNESNGYQAAQKLLADPASRVTAIFCGNDSMAIGALRAAQDLGLSVPEDVSLVGFDGIAQSNLTIPPLTTSRVDIGSMAEATGMLLNHIIHTPRSKGLHVIVPTEFLVRGSTGAPHTSKQ